MELARLTGWRRRLALLYVVCFGGVLVVVLYRDVCCDRGPRKAPLAASPGQLVILSPSKL